MYPNVQLHIAGTWRDAEGGRTIPVLNPATEEQIGTVAHASQGDLDAALAAAAKGFAIWSQTSAFDRAKIMRRAAALLRERTPAITTLMTLEQGKPLFEAKTETLLAADIIEWFAEEARRTYGRVVPARAPGRLSARSEGACRAGRSLYAVELSDQPGRAQALGGAGGGLLDYRQGA